MMVSLITLKDFYITTHFDKVYTKSDYPQEKILSTLGVPDDYLFDFVNSKLDDALLFSR